MFSVGIPELLIYGLPIAAGIVAGRHIGRLANFVLMVGLSLVAVMLLGIATTREFRPWLLIPGILIWAPLSAGGLIPPLVFILVARRVPRLRSEGKTITR